MIGGYRLIELLGRGGMGEVYRAEKEGPGGFRKRAAVKRILPRLQGDPNLRARFVQEARINGYLEHPNVVQVLDFGDQPEPYLALEYVEGTTAARVLKACAERGQRLPPAAVAYLVAEAASGLDYAHRREDEQRRPLQIVHRDVSPQNLLVSLEGTIKVSDFGVARAVLSGAAPGSTVTKLAYAAPELLTGAPADWRVDVFALGVVLWEMLLVRPLVPRSDPNAARQVILAGRFDPPSRVDPQVPQPFDAVVLAALAVDPAQRTQSAGLLAQQLRALIHGLSPGFDASEFVRVLARTLPDIPWRAPSAPPVAAPDPAAPPAGPMAARLATMPPPTRDAPMGIPAMQPMQPAQPMQPMQPAGGFGAPGALPALDLSAPPASPMGAPAAPGLPPLGAPGGGLDLSAAPPPRPALDVAPPPAAIGPLAKPKVQPSQGVSTRAITLGIAFVMIVVAGLIFWWLISGRQPVVAPVGPGTSVAPVHLEPAPVVPPVVPGRPPTEPAPTPAARDYMPRAIAAINAQESAVLACLRADRNLAEECTAMVTFDNANGAAVSSEVTFRAPARRANTARAQQCVQAALQRARFTTDPGATGLTRAMKAWPMGRNLRTGGGGGGGNETIYFPFGVPRH